MLVTFTKIIITHNYISIRHQPDQSRNRLGWGHSQHHLHCSHQQRHHHHYHLAQTAGGQVWGRGGGSWWPSIAGWCWSDKIPSWCWEDWQDHGVSAHSKYSLMHIKVLSTEMRGAVSSHSLHFRCLTAPSQILPPSHVWWLTLCLARRTLPSPWWSSLKKSIWSIGKMIWNLKLSYHLETERPEDLKQILYQHH